MPSINTCTAAEGTLGWSPVWPILVLAAGTLASSSAAQTVDFSAGGWVDLSHAYDERTLYWPTASQFRKETIHEGFTPGGYYYSAYDFATAEHGGTHIDAPIHFHEGRHTVDQIPISRLCGMALVVDVSEPSAFDRDYQILSRDVVDWESAHGTIEPDSIVLFRTGFARHWPDARAYLGTRKRGEAGVAELRFPGIHPDTARMLVERRVAAVGLDTASVDFGQSTDFMTHRILFEANIPAFENLAGLSDLPPRGAWIVALPMNIRGGSGAPLRVAAFVPESASKH